MVFTEKVAFLQIHGSAVVGASSSSSSSSSRLNPVNYLLLSSSAGAAAAASAWQVFACWTTAAHVTKQVIGISPGGIARSSSSAKMGSTNVAEKMRMAKKRILREEILR
jgi:uncharacterized membrane protein AbrB (regulator of aidB expression)